uniref:Uncharacterized protein n=1 Tax=Catagonus wagneri TaxID=51154 RepID=A0A8C3WP92_9CETA
IDYVPSKIFHSNHKPKSIQVWIAVERDLERKCKRLEQLGGPTKSLPKDVKKSTSADLVKSKSAVKMALD